MPGTSFPAGYCFPPPASPTASSKADIRPRSPTSAPGATNRRLRYRRLRTARTPFRRPLTDELLLTIEISGGIVALGRIFGQAPLHHPAQWCRDRRRECLRFLGGAQCAAESPSTGGAVSHPPRSIPTRHDEPPFRCWKIERTALYCLPTKRVGNNCVNPSAKPSGPTATNMIDSLCWNRSK